METLSDIMRKKGYSKRTKYQEENIMATEAKSRYEVIAELEAKKMNLIYAKNNADQELKQKQRGLRDLKREVEDAEEGIKDFKEKMVENKATNDELIKSIDESLKRFTEMMKK